MKLSVHPGAAEANAVAAGVLCRWLAEPGIRTLMVAGGNTPLDLYRRVGVARPEVSRLTVFTLDEYVGVPLEEPGTCANLLRREVAEAWGVAPGRFHFVSSLESEALASVRAHEARIAAEGGLDVLVLGLGQNGHVGFNEPGSAAESVGRVLDLDAVSVEANRVWFGGRHAPSKGVTVGMRTILGARRVLLLAYGAHKRAAVRAMLAGPVGPGCPASFLRGHQGLQVFLDESAGAVESAAS